jgi:hypothetical protein
MKVGDLVRVTYGNPVTPATAVIFGLIVGRSSLAIGYPRTNHVYLVSGHLVRHVSDNYLEVINESR